MNNLHPEQLDLEVQYEYNVFFTEKCDIGSQLLN